MTTYLASREACRYLFAALWHPDVIRTTTGVWRHVAHSRVIVLCGSEGEWKSSTNLWISLMMTSSETAIFSRMEPHATPRMRAWPKSKSFFVDRIISKALWSPWSPDLSPPDFFPVGRLKRKSLCQQATHHTGTGKQHSTWNCCD